METICLMPEFGAVAQDQGEFWLAQPKYANLIAFKGIDAFTESFEPLVIDAARDRNLGAKPDKFQP